MKTITINVPDNCEVQIVRKEEKKECKFKKGDIVYKAGFIAIFEEAYFNPTANIDVLYYSTLFYPIDYRFKGIINCVRCDIGSLKNCRLATEEEKNTLIDALKIEAKDGEQSVAAKKVLKEVFNINIDPVIRTYQDLIKNRIRISGYNINTDSSMSGIEVMSGLMNRRVAASEKVAKSMLAMAMISQLMPYYGGNITDEEWKTDNVSKFVIKNNRGKVMSDTHWNSFQFLAFHTIEQRDNFLKYNEQLVKDYLMID